MKKSRKRHCQNQNRPAVRLEPGTRLPHGVTTESVNQDVQGQPRSQREAVRQAGEGRKKHRNLRPVEWDVQTVGRARNKLPRQFSLFPYVVEEVSPIL